MSKASRDIQDYAAKRQQQLDRARQIREERIRGDKIAIENEPISSNISTEPKIPQLEKKREPHTNSQAQIPTQTTKATRQSDSDSTRKGPLVRKLPWELDQQRRNDVSSGHDAPIDIQLNRRNEENEEVEIKKPSLSVLKSKQQRPSQQVAVVSTQKAARRTASVQDSEDSPKASYPQVNDENMR